MQSSLPPLSSLTHPPDRRYRNFKTSKSVDRLGWYSSDSHIKGLWALILWETQSGTFRSPCNIFWWLRPRLHEQIKHTLFAQIFPELLHTDREFEQIKEGLFAYVNAALTKRTVCSNCLVLFNSYQLTRLNTVGLPFLLHLWLNLPMIQVQI